MSGNALLRLLFFFLFFYIRTPIGRTRRRILGGFRDGGSRDKESNLVTNFNCDSRHRVALERSV